MAKSGPLAPSVNPISCPKSAIPPNTPKIAADLPNYRQNAASIVVDLIVEMTRRLIQSPRAARAIPPGHDKGGMSLTLQAVCSWIWQNRGSYWSRGPGPIKVRRTIGGDAPSVGAAERSIGGLILSPYKITSNFCDLKKNGPCTPLNHSPLFPPPSLNSDLV